MNYIFTVRKIRRSTKFRYKLTDHRTKFSYENLARNYVSGLTEEFPPNAWQFAPTKEFQSLSNISGYNSINFIHSKLFSWYFSKSFVTSIVNFFCCSTLNWSITDCANFKTGWHRHCSTVAFLSCGLLVNGEECLSGWKLIRINIGLLVTRNN